MTRFPPEPNGFLHIGHSKAIAVDFGFARYHDGQCYLRYDDTNPAAEEEQYFESILEMVRWLGFEPFKITYSSDYFDQLYALAVELIKRGKAYVDHSTSEEIAEGRGGKERGPRKANKYRDRPIEESLRDFEDMKNGKYKQGTVTLRMKQDLEGNGNPQMWDLIAYRVLNASHHRTGDKWCIYPTYDFTHCLVDSFENISHSLCTTEFILSRESYEWLCDALEVYKPRQYEFGRLNLEGTITSKRKILKLVREGYVQDWDDPRLYTLLALRRRGIPPGAILSFVNQLGVTTATTSIEGKRLDQTVRQYLETSTPRLMMLLEPLKITLDNVPDDFYLDLERPLHPKEPSMGKAKVPFTKTLYIDASDFRTEDAKDYFRLAPGKTVGLLNAPFPVTCTSFKASSTNPTGVAEIVCRYEDPTFGGEAGKKTKTYIQWIAEHKPSSSPVTIDEVRLFRPLFTTANPAATTNFLEHVDRDSMDRINGAMIEPGFWSVAQQALSEAKSQAEKRTSGKLGGNTTHDSQGAPDRTAKQLYGNEVVRFQAMRIAYFCLDNRDADLDQKRIVLNRIVSLKEDSAKSK
jgi:glutaminyl-tRNA synthetase